MVCPFAVGDARRSGLSTLTDRIRFASVDEECAHRISPSRSRGHPSEVGILLQTGMKQTYMTKRIKTTTRDDPPDTPGIPEDFR
jgi:hypothetical protein